jgi:hypothetical protein
VQNCAKIYLQRKTEVSGTVRGNGGILRDLEK